MQKGRISRKQLWMGFASLLLILPRVSISYVAYGFGSICLSALNRRTLLSVLVSLAVLTSAYTLNFLSGYFLSPAGFLLAILLHLPLIFLIVGVDFDRDRVEPIYVMRFLNLIVFSASILNLTLNHGFPSALPYINYSPDMYYAFFGLGGAKIVTILGFFGLSIELYASDRLSVKKIFWLGIMLSNFIVPSYLIGTICGLFALGVANIRRISVQILILLIGAVLYSFILGRLRGIDTELIFQFGYHPKILAFISLFNLYWGDPITIFTGTGLGQFASTAAEWGSSYLNISTTRSSFSLPGLRSTYFHDEYVGVYLSAAANNEWAIRSSMNKPYSSISVIYGELGLFVGSFVFYRLMKLLRWTKARSKEGLTVFLFVFSIFLLDVWHDNLWFVFCLFVHRMSIKLNTSELRTTSK